MSSKKQVIIIVGLFILVIVIYMFKGFFDGSPDHVENNNFERIETISSSSSTDDKKDEPETIATSTVKSPEEKPVVVEREKPQEVSGTQITKENVLNIVNKARYDAGLPIFKQSSKLNVAANAKLDDMISKKYFDHVSPDGKWYYTFIKESGFNYTYAGENLAEDFYDINVLMYQNCLGDSNGDLHTPKPCGWMNSETHRANILKAGYKEVGIAIEGDTVVVEFGTEIK